MDNRYTRNSLMQSESGQKAIRRRVYRNACHFFAVDTNDSLKTASRSALIS
jgi:hypothetical protein